MKVDRTCSIVQHYSERKQWWQSIIILGVTAGRLIYRLGCSRQYSCKLRRKFVGWLKFSEIACTNDAHWCERNRKMKKWEGFRYYGPQEGTSTRSQKSSSARKLTFLFCWFTSNGTLNFPWEKTKFYSSTKSVIEFFRHYIEMFYFPNIPVKIFSRGLIVFCNVNVLDV
jgi:hypothetical protein